MEPTNEQLLERIDSYIETSKPCSFRLTVSRMLSRSA
jgi:hypothetical protein